MARLLAHSLPRICPLASTPADHPCLWGEIALLPSEPLLVEHDSCLLPTRRSGRSYPWWTTRKQGGVDSQGRPMAALTDLRGAREIYPLPPDAVAAINSNDGEHRSLVLYGGTLYEHFGHLLVDLSRLYRLLPLFRRSRVPIWFHYPALLGLGKTIEHPLISGWLDCLGIRKRARVVTCTLHCEELVSSPVLYRDRCFVTTDFPRVARQALAPKLRRRLLSVQPDGNPIAYLSRHKLTGGTNSFEGEQEVVEALGKLGNVDVICPEELSIEAKLSLYRRYRLVTGFVQAAMLLKYFVPTSQPGDLAEQLMLVAGAQSLNSNWVNLERAYGFGDQLLDCSLSAIAHELPDPDELGGPDQMSGFQRRHRFDVGLVIDQLRCLAER